MFFCYSKWPKRVQNVSKAVTRTYTLVISFHLLGLAQMASYYREKLPVRD